MWQRIRRAVSDDGSGVALFVDGPNVLREEFDVDLDDLRAAAGGQGPVTIARLYLDENAPSGLIRAAEAHGYDVRVTSGDVDVKLAIDATELVLSTVPSHIAVASRDTDFKPLIELASRHGVGTVAIAPGRHGRSDALPATAEHAITLGE